MSTVITPVGVGRSPSLEDRDTAGIGRMATSAAVAIGGLALLALFARIMMEDLRHDEHMFVAAGAILGQFDLYSDFSYSHLPNLALFFNGLFELIGSDHYLLIARLSLFATWIVLLLGMYLTAARLSGSRLIGGLAMLLLVSDGLYISHVGMVVSNNIYAAALTVYGLFFFLVGLERADRRPLWIALAGVLLSLGAGVKANFIAFVLPIALAAFILPAALTFRQRFVSVVLPLAIGGIIGALPTFAYLIAHGEVMVFNVFDYHTGPHREYWREPARAAEVTGMSLPSRALYAYQIWTAGTTFLIFLGALGLAAVAAWRRGLVDGLAALASGPVFLVTILVLAGIAICFPVLPSFPQYYMPPIPFAVLLIAALYGRLAPEEIRTAAPLLSTIALAAFVVGAPRLFADLPSIASPERWTAFEVHAVAEDIGAAVTSSGQNGPVATLVPIYALEAGLEIYPEFATGPFYYRVGDYLTAEERETFRIASPTTLDALFERTPPAAILTGYEGGLDLPFDRYGEANGYEALPTVFGKDRYGEGMLWLPEAR
jgi:4-amino-4-deoxy-L-arabinose transferase-like glycosyltransferase